MIGKVKLIAKHFKEELQVYRLVIKDKRTPQSGKFLLGLAVGYFFLPFDLIPDFIPVLGQIDDAIIIPLLVYTALKLIPAEIIEDCRKQVRSERKKS